MIAIIVGALLHKYQTFRFFMLIAMALLVCDKFKLRQGHNTSHTYKQPLITKLQVLQFTMLIALPSLVCFNLRFKSNKENMAHLKATIDKFCKHLNSMIVQITTLLAWLPHMVASAFLIIQSIASLVCFKFASSAFLKYYHTNTKQN